MNNVSSGALYYLDSRKELTFMTGTIMLASRQVRDRILVLVAVLGCFFAPKALYGDAHDICTRAADLMHKHASSYKKYVKEVESDFKKLRSVQSASHVPGLWWLNDFAKKIARKRGCTEKEFSQARVLSRFVDSDKPRKAAITAVMHSYGAAILERVFTALKDQFGSLRQTPEIRAALIELFHQEMMVALELNGSKDWFCGEIERKNNKDYVITGGAFTIYLQQTAVALFAMYWFEKQVPK
jgi:hypothetical protein